MGSYLFDQSWAREKRRLDALGDHFDAGSIALLERNGVAPGARCLEVGAGSGSLARWMAETVGPTGVVVATDLDVKFLEPLAGGVLEVRRHDIATDELERGAFDVVHARTVLQHVPQREAALARMVAALRPGGRILIEDIVAAETPCFPPLPPFSRLMKAMAAALRARGADPDYGLQLPAALAAAGLRDLGQSARANVVRTGTGDSEFLQLSLEHAGPHLVAAGVVDAADLDAVLAAIGSPGYTTVTAILIAAWGTAPE